MMAEIELKHDKYGLEIIEKGLELYIKQQEKLEHEKVSELVNIRHMKEWIEEVQDQVVHGLTELE